MEACPLGFLKTDVHTIKKKKKEKKESKVKGNS